MKRTALSLTILTLICCASEAVGQDDSSRLDAGYITLKREFTQTISIKGSDLEKMPFANLSDALAAWLYGAYTLPLTLQYVVDGSPVADVNAYSNYYSGSAYVIAPVGQISFPFAPTYVTPVYWVWQAGATYTGWKDRLTVQYSFERRNFLELFYLIVPAGGNSSTYDYEFPQWRSILQHADVRVKILNGEGLRWQTGVNLTLLYNKTGFITNYFMPHPGKQDVGDDYPGPHSWTGGWVNRVEVNGFMAGFDLMYHIGETMLNPNNGYPDTDTSKVNSVMIPNIYFGYRWPLSYGGTVEFFVESRGLIRNSSSDLEDPRRYYTIGGKLDL